MHYGRRSCMFIFLIYPSVFLAITFSSAPLYLSEYPYVLQLSVNYCGKSLCNEHMYIYQPLKGASVNYPGNSLCDERNYQPYMECQ